MASRAALLGAGRFATLRLWRRRGGAPALEVRAQSRRLAWEPPATTISVAGVHGGAGASTLCLLLAHVMANCAPSPPLALDLAGRSRGGLAVLAGAASQATVEATALVSAVHGGKLERPLAITDAGVRLIGAYPDGAEDLDRSHETIVARLARAADDEADDGQLGGLARRMVREQRGWQAMGFDDGQTGQAIGRIVDHAIAHHSLIAVDLGMRDSAATAQVVAARSDLHVWVLPGRAASLQVAQRRLPELPFEAAGKEAIAVWQAGESAVSSRRLSELGDLRGCPVVRVGGHGGERGDWTRRSARSLSGIVDLCALAR